jgi:hypothetical protein
MATKTKAQINSEISSLLADNTTGDISAQDIRTVTADITDSYEDLITAGTTSQYWRGDKTWQTLQTLELTGSLTAAQINALDTTPISLLSAPGANKYYVIENVSIHFKANTSAFTGGFTYLQLTYDGQFIMNVIPEEFMATTSYIYNSYPSDYEFTQTNSLNKNIEIQADSAISGGDGTINYSIRYRIVTTS